MRLWDPGAVAKTRSKLSAYMRLIRVEHTLFSLPFAAIGLMVARSLNPLVYLLAFISLFGLRTASMAFNNMADADIDALNPRTRSRPLVVGVVSEAEAVGLVALGLVIYYLAAYAICYQAVFYATPLAVLALSYPFAKRVHSLPHIHLGLVLGLAVFGGWVAGACSVKPCVSLSRLLLSAPWLIILGVTLWVAGFDTLYSIMDYEFDVRNGLNSLPVYLGPRLAARVSVALEAAAAILWSLGGYFALGLPALISSLVAGLVSTLAAIRANLDPRRIPEAFKANLAVGFIALTGYIIGLVK